MSQATQGVTDPQVVAVRAASLERPTETDVRYPYDKWRTLLSSLSADEALAARRYTTNSFVQSVLGGVAVKQTGDTALLDKAIDIRAHDEAPVNRVQNRATATLEHLPLVSASLLCGWVDHINVYERDYYKENVRDAIGYYHPNKHYIDVASDYSDPSHHWARNKEYDASPEYSTTVHELGHALHYMNGVRIRNPDTLNNNEREDIALNLRSGIQRADWQEAFLWDGIEGYYNVWQGRYDHLRALSKYQKSTLEEYFAIAFEAWITAPSRLYEEQPVAWRAFERLP